MSRTCDAMQTDGARYWEERYQAASPRAADETLATLDLTERDWHQSAMVRDNVILLRRTAGPDTA